jgi:DNA-directed RNA polymerase II subunit RPB11
LVGFVVFLFPFLFSFPPPTMNAPERSASFLLDEDAGEVKVVYTPDTKVSNAGTFRFNKEDHTISNLLRMQLLRDPSVRFAGYQHPHPLVHYINFKVQTNSSTVTPVEVLSSAIEDLSNETDHLITAFTESVEDWKKENETGVMGQF